MLYILVQMLDSMKNILSIISDMSKVFDTFNYIIRLHIIYGTSNKVLVIKFLIGYGSCFSLIQVQIIIVQIQVKAQILALRYIKDLCRSTTIFYAFIMFADDMTLRSYLNAINRFKLRIL